MTAFREIAYTVADGVCTLTLDRPQRLNAVTTNLERLTSNLNDGQGTMGQLLKDKQLYENLNKTLGEMQGLLAAIKQDPKKYLNLRMSIF